MDDTTVSIKYLQDQCQQFVDERDWEQFHAPKNLSMALAVEAAELMELFAWVDEAISQKMVEDGNQKVERELADVIIAALLFARRSHIDITQAVLSKIEEIKQKYPIEKAKGNNTKYTDL